MGARIFDVERGEAGSALRAERLRRSSDVRSTFTSGRAVGTPLLVVHARRRADEGPSRATVVAGKKVGNAVTRNRVKRRLRAALTVTVVPAGLDVVVVGRKAAATAPFAALLRDLGTAVDTAVSRA